MSNITTRSLETIYSKFNLFSLCGGESDDSDSGNYADDEKDSVPDTESDDDFFGKDGHPDGSTGDNGSADYYDGHESDQYDDESTGYSISQTEWKVKGLALGFVRLGCL
jgi:hypothetical protein